jgi:hypothetical protein
LAAKALCEVTAAFDAAPDGDGLADSVQAAAQLAQDTDEAAKVSHDAETKALELLQSHKNTTFSTPYDRN